MPIQDTIATLFYDRLFVVAPDDLGGRKRKLMKLLTTCIGGLHDFSTLAPAVREMGTRHVGYGAVPEHYATVGEALLWALARGLGVAFDSDTRSAWVNVYELLAQTMQTGAGATARVAPSIRTALQRTS